MKFTIMRKNLAFHLIGFAERNNIYYNKIINDIVSFENFKSFKDIEKAFKNYKIIKENNIFDDKYINKVVAAYKPFEEPYKVLVKTKGKIKYTGESLDSTLTINCSLEEYSKLDLHNIGVKNTLALLKNEGVTEDSVLNFYDIIRMIKKYEIVNCYTYIGKKMYRNYDMISCEPYGKAVLIEHKAPPMSEEEYKYIMEMLGIEV